MSSNTKSKNQPVELRRSARHSKSKSLDNQNRNSKTKSPGTKPSTRGSSLQATTSIPNGSRSNPTKTARLEVTAKRNGTFRRLRSVEKDGAKPVDLLNHDEEVSPLRSNRVRFIVQSKRKQLPVRNESTAKRTRKHKENFDAFFEGDAKVVNSELDIKTNPTLPTNEKSPQDSSSANEQSCDNSETLNGHIIIGDDSQTKCEPQAIDSDESSFSETAASSSSTPAEENLDEVSVNISSCLPTNEENKTSFMKSFDLLRVKVQTSCEVEECNELENEELESCKEVLQEQSIIKSTKENINEGVENTEVNENLTSNIKEAQVDKASDKPQLNTNIKNKLNEDCDDNAKEKGQENNEINCKKDLIENTETTETELNRSSPIRIKEELGEIEVPIVDQEMEEATVESINQKINVSSEKNTKLNTICADGIQEVNVADKKEEVKEIVVKDIKQEIDENSMENIELELRMEMNAPNESSMEQAEQEESQNCVGNLICINDEITTEIGEQSENNTETGPGFDKNSSESIELEVNATSCSNIEEEENTINAETIDQESNMELEFNRNSIETIEEEVSETMKSIKRKLDCSSSIENIEQESVKQELNGSSLDSIDRLDRKPLDTLSEEQPCNVENSQELKSSKDKKCSYGFEPIDENICRFSRKNHKNRKQVRRLLCDCTWEEEDYLPGVLGCGEECLNRILMIECGARCRIGNKCSNKRFQRREYAETVTFQADSKGTGLKAAENVKSGRFVIEFVGEVLNGPQFKQRVKQYARENTVHHYFMALSNDEIIDATQMGNFSRFINHSCDPNCETQKWTVNGELRVGFFAKCDIKEGEELTFDYKFQIYGREAQKCFCGAEKCKGYIGQVKPMLIDSVSGKSSSRRRKATEEKRRGIFEDFSVEEEIEKLCENRCLRNREDTLLFARLMVRVEDVKIRLRLLDVLLKTTEQACLRMFLDYHGLSLIWSWMVEGTDLNLRYKILEVLSVLPVLNKTILIRSKVLKEVEKWCMPPPPPPSKERVSENAEVEVTFDDGEGNHHAIELVELANKLLDTWKLLKEAFRIPRVEEPKKRVSNYYTDYNAPFKDSSGGFSSPKVVDEGKVSTEQTSTNKSKDDGRNKFNSAIEVIDSSTYRSKKNLALHVLGAKHAALSKIERRQLFAASMAQLYPLKQFPLKDLSKESTPENSWTPEMSNDEGAAVIQERPSLIPTIGYAEPLSVPASQLSAANSFPSASQQLTNVPPPMMFHPPNITVPPPQLPFLGVPPPVLPSVTSAAGPSAIPVRASSGWMTDPTSSTSPVTYGPPPVYPPPSSTMNCLSQPLPAMQPYQNAPPPTTGVSPFAPYTSCQSQPFHYPQAPNASPAMGQFTTQSFDPMPDADGYLTLRVKLPPDWKAAGDGQGNVYFYHTVTRKTQWHPPMFSNPESMEEEEVTASTADEPQSYMEQSENCSTFEDQTQEEEEDDDEEEEEDQEEVIVDDCDLPPNWKSAKDAEGHTYYYNVITRNTQWSPPSCEKSTKDVEEEDEDDDSGQGRIENIVDEDASNTPLMDEPQYPKKKMKKLLIQESPSQESTPSEQATPTLDGTPTLDMPSQEADSSSGAKKIKEKFKVKLSALVIRCLNQYRKPNCEAGRITNITDFRYLARKLTHCLMYKELRHCKNIEDLHYSEVVRNKAHDYIEKYMNKYGPVYKNEKSQSEKTQDES